MRFTLSWLKRFLDTNAPLEEIANKLTMIGLEIEDIDNKFEELKDFEVAEIVKTMQHPDADKLQICSVKTKSDILQIVCGAANARTGIKVVLANIETIIPKGNFKIKKSKVRGIESAGMLCSAEELGLPGDSSGIIELPDNAIIGDNITKYLGVDDPMLHINITPNRADALGVYGIARDLAASGLGIFKNLSIPKIDESFNSNIKLINNDHKAIPFFAIREIKNIDNHQSPAWLRNYLENIGVGSISPVVDVTNYISYSFGQPMHAYDLEKLSGDLIVETISDSIKFKALNEKEYELSKDDIVVRDVNQVHCLAGIIGSENSACSAGTTKIILEAASFCSENIAKTGRRIQVDTDSRYRFERNVDRSFTLKALDIATDMILSICGGEASEVISTGDDTLPIRKIDFPISYLKEKTDLDIDIDKIQQILSDLGFSCNLSEKVLNITIPSWRYDVSIKEDIIEEIVRIYGYENIPETPLPSANITRIIPKDQKRVYDLKRLMASIGYTELITWSFMDSQKAKLFTSLKHELTLQNPISSDLDYMRPSIIPNLLEAAKNNLNRSIPNLSLFEIGPIFEDAGDQLITNVSGLRVGAVSSKNNHGENRKFDVFDIKADIADILAYVGLDINKCQIKYNVPDYYHPTRSASLYLGKNILGYFGQVHPLILKQFEINLDIMIFEINISKLPFSKNKFGMKPDFISSDYQKISRDYAFIVDKDQPVGDMLNLILSTNKKLIKSVEIFDIYSGENIEVGKKSVALSVGIQDNDKTLVESEIEEINRLIIDNITKKFNAKLRDT